MTQVREFEIPGLGRFSGGIEVHLQPRQKDGTVYVFGSRYLWIGTAPLTELEQAGREARLLVRRLYAEAGIMDWLGRKVNSEPSGREIYEALQRNNFEHTPMTGVPRS